MACTQRRKGRSEKCIRAGGPDSKQVWEVTGKFLMCRAEPLSLPEGLPAWALKPVIQEKEILRERRPASIAYHLHTLHPEQQLRQFSCAMATHRYGWFCVLMGALW